jgi:hypothetical protein
MEGRIDMVLEYANETVSASVKRTYSAIEHQRTMWINRYGLTKKKDFKMYLRIPSAMGMEMPFRTKTPLFKNNINEQSETIADSIR